MFNSLNKLYYFYKRNYWLLSPFSFFSPYYNITLYKPIFLLGVQGGGLTLVSRMLRKHLQIVSVSGNCHYWSGADEMHTVFGPLLPPDLTGTRYKVPCPDHPQYGPPRSWAYACDELLPYYRKTADDSDDKISEEFKRIIRMCLARHALDSHNARFIDKSQVYTVRVGLIRELLRSHDPRFILIPVNPYASCYRAALGKAQDMNRLTKTLSFEQRLRICAEHWANSMRCALKDADEDLLVIRFEDILHEPEHNIQKICEHCGITFYKDMLPSPEDKVPFGSRFRDRWYPLQPDRALHYIQQATREQLEIIKERCGDVARELGYENHP